MENARTRPGRSHQRPAGSTRSLAWEKEACLFLSCRISTLSHLPFPSPSEQDCGEVRGEAQEGWSQESQRTEHAAEASTARGGKLCVRGGKTVRLGFDQTGLSSLRARNDRRAPSRLLAVLSGSEGEKELTERPRQWCEKQKPLLHGAPLRPPVGCTAGWGPEN